MIQMRTILSVILGIALVYVVFFPNPLKSMFFGGSSGTQLPQKNSKNISVGEGAGGTISCEGKPIQIDSAVYQKSSKYPHDGPCPGADVKDKLSQAVGNSDTYTFPSSLNGIFGDPCPGVHKEVNITPWNPNHIIPCATVIPMHNSGKEAPLSFHSARQSTSII
jgi:hypothetical protein